MGFYEEYLSDSNAYEQKFKMLKLPLPNPHIVKITAQLDIPVNIKKAILAIDTSMRFADTIEDDNKDTHVLATDLLSALFYKYVADDFDGSDFKKLTQAVMQQNMLKSMKDRDDNWLKQVEGAFVLPFGATDLDMLLADSPYLKYIK